MLFEIFLQSDPEGYKCPFPGCVWNQHEKRWEYECEYSRTLTSLAKNLGCSIIVRPEPECCEDPPSIEICDVGLPESEG